MMGSKGGHTVIESPSPQQAVFHDGLEGGVQPPRHATDGAVPAARIS